MALKRRLIRRIVGGTKRILKKLGSRQVAKAREIEAATIVPLPRFKNDVADATSMPGLQQGPQGPSRVLALIEHDDDDAVALAAYLPGRSSKHGCGCSSHVCYAADLHPDNLQD